MLVLKADPWMPDHGMGFEVSEEEAPAPANPFVETEDWSRPIVPTAVPGGPVWFVDGVRRVELRLIAQDHGVRAPGLFGSYAVGTVRSEARAAFREAAVARSVVLGGGLVPEPVQVAVGGEHLAFGPASDPGSDPDRPLWRLQQLMREAEGSLAARVAWSEGDLVLADGPLTFFDATGSPVVGIVKRFGRVYLERERESLLPRLEAGERTPLFLVGEEGARVERYAWYTRLVPLRTPWHDHAGVVRCEVRAGVGLDEASRLADRVSALLPPFAGRASDPRAPQNLAPVGRLEAWLRHRMGDAAMLRRALMAWLAG